MAFRQESVSIVVYEAVYLKVGITKISYQLPLQRHWNREFKELLSEIQREIKYWEE
jgi:hypothetical protein